MKPEKLKEVIQKQRQDEDRDNDDYESIDNEYELIQKIIKVNIKDSPLSSDYVLAKLNDDEKKFIRNNAETATFALTTMMRYATRGYKYIWDDERGDWIRDLDGTPKKVPIDEELKKRILDNCNKLFKSYMLMSDSIVTLNRNDPLNHIINLAGGKARDIEETKQPEKTEEKSLWDNVKENL